jgi:hypothetical protein
MWIDGLSSKDWELFFVLEGIDCRRQRWCWGLLAPLYTCLVLFCYYGRVEESVAGFIDA